MMPPAFPPSDDGARPRRKAEEEMVNEKTDDLETAEEESVETVQPARPCTYCGSSNLVSGLQVSQTAEAGNIGLTVQV